MNKKNLRMPLIGVLCALVLVAVVLLAVFWDSIVPEPILGILRPDPTTEATEATENSSEDPTKATTQESAKKPTENATQTGDEQVTPPDQEELPSTVIIPSENDPQTGESVITFPCQVPGYGLVIEKMAPYSGMFVEDGTNATVENVAMLLVKNTGDFPVEYTQIRVMYRQEELLFDISALPVGQTLVAQEKNGKTIEQGAASAATALVVQRAEMTMSEEQVKVTDNGDNTLTIENLTDKTIPTVRVFYKYYMENEEVFVGGIAFTVRITRLGAGASVTIQPSHYTSQTSRVVMVLTYDSEV